MGKILVKNDRGYGCFIAGYKCSECNKVVLTKEFSWSTDKIGLGNDEGIIESLKFKTLKQEINYCCKCGADLK